MQQELDVEAIELTKDYESNIVLIGEIKNYYVKINHNNFTLSWMDKETYRHYVQPFIKKKDSIIYYSDFQPHYPQFTYYAYCSADSTYKPFKKIVNEEYLHEYNMEYYFLKPRERVDARNMAMDYNVDVHIVAAAMSGLTSSIFYEPLYDPMFIINDTICIFNHCNNLLLKYDKNLNKTDSIAIDYHHPKNWREWKKRLIEDENNSSVYSLYEKNGFYWLKQINLHTGKVNGSFKLLNPNIEEIKVKDGYVYYIYRPFESLQQQFLYKELINLE